MTNTQTDANSHGAPAGAPGAARAELALSILPGHLIRRLQQIAVAIFLDETRDSGVTPIQFAALQQVANQPGIDQRTLASAVGLDTSTVAGVVDRLELRGLLTRNASRHDRRVRQLELTEQGRVLCDEIRPAVMRAQERMLAPLDHSDRQQFLTMLAALVSANNGLSRAPSEI